MFHRSQLRYLGFCGVDDSIDPRLLGLISHSYPFVEFGVLFRPDKEGEPRYASKDWVNGLVSVAATSKINLAAHLCGQHANNLIGGDATFVEVLLRYGFQRIQINATAVNGVDLSMLIQKSEAAYNIVRTALQFPSIEFIIQKNEETRPLWEELVKLAFDDGIPSSFPKNITMLLDESKGTGKQIEMDQLQPPPLNFDFGYAGGIGPSNITTVLQSVMSFATERAVWIDMESSLRSIKDGKDIFDLYKCYSCISSVCALGLHQHPDYLASR